MHQFPVGCVVCCVTSIPFADRKARLSFVYIGIARFVFIYVYSAAMTYTALRLGRNLRHDYMRSALRQDTAAGNTRAHAELAAVRIDPASGPRRLRVARVGIAAGLFGGPLSLLLRVCARW